MAFEDDQLILGLKNCYGMGTRSYNRSAEKREMDKQRKSATKLYAHESVDVLICHCLSFHHPHFIDQHKLLRCEYDWSLPRVRNVIFWENLR